MKNFGFPLSLDHARRFCHPASGHVFSRPWAAKKMTWVANGYVCLQIDTWLDVPAENDAARKRTHELPWHTVTEWNQDDENTGVLDDRRGGLFQFGEQEMWRRNTAGLWQANVKGLVAVGHYSTVIPIAVLQLIAKLPRAKVRVKGGGCHFLPFTFSGGRGLAAAIAGAQMPNYQIFKGKEYI